MKQYAAEFFGTFWLVLGAVAVLFSPRHFPTSGSGCSE